jgi:hypothetical protein
MLKLNRKWVTLAIVAVLVLSFGGLIAARVKQKNEREAALKNMTPPLPAVAVSHPRLGTLSDKLTLSLLLLKKKSSWFLKPVGV